VRGVRPRPPPFGWDSPDDAPKLGWRRRKEIIGGAFADADEVGVQDVPALRFLNRSRWASQEVNGTTVVPEAIPGKKRRGRPRKAVGAEPTPERQEAPHPQPEAFHERPSVSSAARVRAWYARRKKGKRIYRLELEEGATVDLVVNAGLLPLVDGDDHPKVEQALQRLNEIMIEDDQRG
jgi:hypothetical protein